MLGLAAIVAGTASYCVGSVVARPLTHIMKPQVLTLIQATIGGPALLLISLILEPISPPGVMAVFSLKGLPSVGFLSLLGTIVAYTIYLVLLREWGTARPGLYAFVSPIVALTLGTWPFGASIGPVEVGGALLMGVAAAIAFRRQPPRSGLRRSEAAFGILGDLAMTSYFFETAIQRLVDATVARSAFNFHQLATIGLDGSPSIRTIVLRRFDPKTGTLSFVADIRSPKIHEISRDPRVSLVGYDPAASLQLRVSGRAEVVMDDKTRRELWETLKDRTIILFDAPVAPGTVWDAAGSPPDDGLSPYDRFALVAVTLSRIEWLDVSSPGNQRYAFERHGDRWNGQRLAP